jgi:hypothetical protein
MTVYCNLAVQCKDFSWQAHGCPSRLEYKAIAQQIGKLSAKHCGVCGRIWNGVWLVKSSKRIYQKLLSMSIESSMMIRSTWKMNQRNIKRFRAISSNTIKHFRRVLETSKDLPNSFPYAVCAFGLILNYQCDNHKPSQQNLTFLVEKGK